MRQYLIAVLVLSALFALASASLSFSTAEVEYLDTFNGCTTCRNACKYIKSPIQNAACLKACDKFFCNKLASAMSDAEFKKFFKKVGNTVKKVGKPLSKVANIVGKVAPIASFIPGVGQIALVSKIAQASKVVGAVKSLKDIKKKGGVLNIGKAFLGGKIPGLSNIAGLSKISGAISGAGKFGKMFEGKLGEGISKIKGIRDQFKGRIGGVVDKFKNTKLFQNYKQLTGLKEKAFGKLSEFKNKGIGKLSGFLEKKVGSNLSGLLKKQLESSAAKLEGKLRSKVDRIQQRLAERVKSKIPKRLREKVERGIAKAKEIDQEIDNLSVGNLKQKAKDLVMRRINRNL